MNIQSVLGQTIPLELFISNKNMQSTIVVSKPFIPESKFRILTQLGLFNLKITKLG